MLGGIEHWRCDGLVEVGAQDRARRGEGAADRARPARSNSRSTASINAASGVTRMTCARRVMFGLAEQVGGDGGRVGAGVGDDHQFGRAGGQVDAGAAGERGDERLGRRDPGVARAGDAVDRRDVARAEGQRGDRLRPADGPDGVDPALLGGERDRRVEPAVAARRGDDDQLRRPRRRAREWRASAGSRTRAPCRRGRRARRGRAAATAWRRCSPGMVTTSTSRGRVWRWKFSMLRRASASRRSPRRAACGAPRRRTARPRSARARRRRCAAPARPARPSRARGRRRRSSAPRRARRRRRARRGA